MYKLTEKGSNPHDEKEKFFNTFRIETTDRIAVEKDISKRESWTYKNDILYLGFIKTGTNIYTLELTNKDIK